MTTLNEHILNLLQNIYDARNYGLKWPDYKLVINQALSEIEEIKEAIGQKQSKIRVIEEIGDLIHVCCSLTIYLNLNLQLNDQALLKFESSFSSYELDDIKNIIDSINEIEPSSENFDKIKKIFSYINKLCIDQEINICDSIKAVDEKFVKRFGRCKQLAKQELGIIDMNNTSHELKYEYWKKLKNNRIKL